VVCARQPHPRDTEEGEVARSRRRDEDAPDEEFDDTVDELALSDDDDADEFEDVEDDVLVGRGGTATKTRARSSSDTTDSKIKVSTEESPAGGVFGRLGRFLREVVAELRKVIWPTRSELVTYAAVVLVFVTIMLTIVGLLDLGFSKAVLFVFGGKTK
jgi:preprotein translocase subunit SecE